MNNRHRRVAKLKKQELNSAKAKFKNEYGISAEEAVRLTRKFVKAFGQMVEDFGNAFASLGENLRRNMEEKE